MYQAKVARGLLASTSPMVLPRVACSIAYPLAVFLNLAALWFCSRSVSSSVPMGFAGSVMAQKLTTSVRLSHRYYQFTHCEQLVMVRVSKCNVSGRMIATYLCNSDTWHQGFWQLCSRYLLLEQHIRLQNQDLPSDHSRLQQHLPSQNPGPAAGHPRMQNRGEMEQ